MNGKRIDLRVDTITNTQLVVKFSGGRVGNYDLVVYRVGWGNAKPTN